MSELTTRVFEAFPYHWRVRVKERLARMGGVPWDELARLDAARFDDADLDDSARAIVERVRPYTLTPPGRVAALCGAVDYLVDHDVPGAFVECGLWKGGSLMAAALRLRDRGVTDREVVGFDTFTGMTDPGEFDQDFRGIQQVPEDAGSQLPKGMSLPEVTENLRSTGYPADRIRLVAGDVADTVPAQAPERIALLRLDTDFYESTRHELEQLYPRLVEGGVLLIDDYGHYRGSRKAVDEYFRDERILLVRIDFSARMAIKQSASTAS